MKLQYLAASLALGVTLVAGCHADESLNSPALGGGELFRRYVALGTSISAGFQSGGINDSTQRLAFPFLFAKQAGTSFVYPSIRMPGCPAPFTNNVTQARVGVAGPTACALRNPNTSDVLNNVAVPGAMVLDLLNNGQTPFNTYEQLVTFFTGGYTELQLMKRARPTFVSVEMGANDVLGALLGATDPGNAALVTSGANFATYYGQVLDSIEATGAKAVLLTVPDVTTIPYASKGAVYWCLKNAPTCGPPFPATSPFPATFTVDNNCAPAAVIPTSKGDSTLIPWPIGVPRIAAATGGASTSVDCSVDADVVLPDEFAAMRDAVVSYNATINAEAAARNWAVFDLNGALQALVGAGQIPPFPDLSAALSGGNVTFGNYVSLDGFHPSSLAQKTIANAVIATVNAKYSTTVPVIP